MRRLLALFTSVAALLAVTAQPAHADPVGNASGDGKNYEASTQSRIQMGGSGYSNEGSSQTKVWTDVCWYEPRFTYEEMVAYIQQNHSDMQNSGGGGEAGAAQWRTTTLEEIKQYEGQPGKIFWFMVSNGSQEGDACVNQAGNSWIYNTSTEINPNDQLLDIMDLVLLARANLTVPEPEIRLNPPGGRSYVGLATWVGVEDQEEVVVTATMPGFPELSASITAVPGQVTITASGGDPEIQDKRVECPIYEKGMKEEEGCWIRFNRASLGTPYTITVHRTWEVTANVPNAPPLPPGEGEATVEINIDEIQSNVVKGGGR